MSEVKVLVYKIELWMSFELFFYLGWLIIIWGFVK